MTTTRSKVTRKTTGEYSVLFAKPRAILTTIAPGDVLEFKEHGRRAVFRMSIQTAFRYAVQLSAMKVGKRIKELRKAGVPLSEARRRAEKEFLA